LTFTVFSYAITTSVTELTIALTLMLIGGAILAVTGITLTFYGIVDIVHRNQAKSSEVDLMRGLQRLANATRAVVSDMDAQADALATELETATADSKQALAGFGQYISEIKANTAEVRDVLNQLTNSPLPASGA
jgi:cell division FtsZ-interacting protein ZapD